MRVFMIFVSAVGHPLLMATYMTLLLVFLAPEMIGMQVTNVAWGVVLFVFVLTAVLPALVVYLLKLFSYVSDLEVTRRKERMLPMYSIVLFYLMANYFLVYRLSFERVFDVMIVSVTVLIFLLLIVTMWFKISMHCAAVWSAVGYMLALIMRYSLVEIYWIALGGIVLAGLVATSRLYLGYHQPKEVWAGSIVGLVFSFAALMLF